MNFDQKEKYKLEYAEVGHLRRHYSTVRSGLTTFSMTASLAAFASYFSQAVEHFYLAFVGLFMLVAAALACLAFSYRCEKTNLYAAVLWRWFGAEDQDGPPSFYQYKPTRIDVVREMFRDEMNWLMLISAILIAGVFFFYR